ncbi:MAG: phenylalanine--tRNA ligase subunit beta [Nanoarchaeota archaeon]
MPKVILDRKEVEKLIEKKLTTEELKDSLTFLGTDLDKIDDREIIVEIFPDRPDLLSEAGLARALASFIGYKTGLRKYKVLKSDYKVIIHDSVKDVRPYTACAVVKNLKLNDARIKQIIQLQEKLHITYGRNRKKVAIGIYPFEKIKFPIRFLAKQNNEIKFQPLDFDKELTANEILERHPAGKEYGHLLKDFKKYPLFIDANNNILSMPPIINSELTGKVTEKTKDIFIECSGFDFRILKKCLNIIVCALADLNGVIYENELIYDNKKEITPNLIPEEMKLDINYANKILGLNLNENDVKKLLERMGYNYENKTVLIPAYRADILHEIDLVEDIGIAYGFNNFKEQIPNIATIGEENNFYLFKEKIANLLTGYNLIEVRNYNLTNKNNLFNKMNYNGEAILLANSISQGYDTLRTWIIPSLIETLAKNKHNEYPQNIFEIGTIFKKGDTETGIIENERLAIALCHSKANFTEIKQILDSLLLTLGLKYEIKEIEHSSFIPGRVGRVSVNNKNIAYIGEIHPKVLENWSLEIPVATLELNLTELYNLIKLTQII